MIKRRVEIISFQRERIVRQPPATFCPVCYRNTELLTTCQAGALAKVKAGSIRRWLAQGRAHGVKTSGGQHRICRNSLFRLANPIKTYFTEGVSDERSRDSGQVNQINVL